MENREAISINELMELNESLFETIVKDRRHLHQNPELSFQEVETSLYIRTQLDALGIVWALCGDNGIVGLLKGELPGDGVVALRADFDALPIEEKTSVSFASTKKGVMHACGHDVHTASLLGVARILVALKGRFAGTVKFLFQPAEEKYPGGAKGMVEAGALENPKVDCVIAQHVMPELESGFVGIGKGVYSAANDEVVVKVFGKGGHGSQPHALVDPIVITAQVIVALQQLVSRMADPLEPTVLSFGRIIGEGASNVIPSEVEVYGTLRTFNPEWRLVAHERIRQVVKHTAQAFGASAVVEIKGFPNVVNQIDFSSEVEGWAKEFLGAEKVFTLGKWMAGEDFGEFTKEVPGCYYRLGSGNVTKGISAPLHSPYFDIDEPPVFKIGSPLMAYIALQKLLKL